MSSEELLQQADLEEKFKNNKRVSKKRKKAFLNDLKKNVDVLCYINLIYCYLLDYSMFTLVVRSLLQSSLSNPLPSQILEMGLTKRKKQKLLKISYFTPLLFNICILLIRLLFYNRAEYYSTENNSFKMTYSIRVIGETHINFALIIFLDILIIVLQCLLYSIWYTDAKQNDADLVLSAPDNESDDVQQSTSQLENRNTIENIPRNEANNYNEVIDNHNNNDENDEVLNIIDDYYDSQDKQSKYEDGYSGKFNVIHVDLIEVFKNIWSLNPMQESTFEDDMNLDQHLDAYIQNHLRNATAGANVITDATRNANNV